MSSQQDNDSDSGTSWNPAFIGYLKSKWKMGVNIDGEPLNYVTQDILREYWTGATVSRILNTGAPNLIPQSSEVIITSYIRVWSTLVFIGRPGFIAWFRSHDRHDESFYANGFTESAENDPLLQDMLKEFGEHWSKFWPVRFQSTDKLMHQKELDSQRVLPIKISRQLTQQRPMARSIINEVDLDPLCCEYSNTKVVFKVYTDTGPSAAQAFAKEVEIFDTVGGRAKEAIVEYLGSFIQNGKRVIVLEHADGNLQTFFESHRGPRDNAELIYLWRALFKLGNAVYHLHHPGRLASGITHRDIKFENILFFKHGGADAYEFAFKLTDFDTSTPFQRTRGQHGRHDSGGSRTHCAPEASRVAEFTEDTLEELPLDSDIWQLGTVFSEALICILWDLNSLSTYETKRKQETSSNPQLASSGLENCFHNGEKRLACIEEIHQQALLKRPAFDRISAPVVTLIEDEMLIPHEKGRVQPKFLSDKFETLLERSRRESNVSEALYQASPRTPTRNHTISGAFPVAYGAVQTDQEHLHGQGIRNSQSFQTIDSFDASGDSYHYPDLPNTNGMPRAVEKTTNGTQREAAPKNGMNAITEDEAVARDEKERFKRSFPIVSTNDVNLWRKKKSWKKGGDLPQGLQEIIDELKDRDQVFVIDDAQSMKAHISHIISTAEAMISLARKADPDGVEVIFTSNPGEIRKKRTLTLKSETNDLVKQISKKFDDSPLPGSTNMENKLGTVLERVVLNGKKTSVYVLTDGLWQDSDEPGGGVEAPIQTLISSLRKKGRNRTAVTIQFIQFGIHEIGSQRLAWLDDELPKTVPGLRNFDIVDTRRHDDDNLYLLMIGALRRYIDNIK